MRTIRTAIILSLLIPHATCAFRSHEGFEPPAAQISVGASLGLERLELLDGGTRRVVREGRKGTLLAVWATWCQYCKAEIPELKEFYKHQPPDGIELVAVNTGESRRRIKAFLSENELPYLVAIDPEQKIMTRLNDKALPAILLVDDQGIIRFVGNHLPKDPQELDRALRSN